MSRHLSVATVIEKNLIASDKAFILLLAIEITGEDGLYAETLRLCRNSENIVYKGETYTASAFTFSLKLDTESEPSLDIGADDPTGFIREKMELYGGGMGFDCTLTIVNTGNMDQDPEIEEVFEVIGASAEGYNISFSLGVQTPLNSRFPRRTQMRDQCPLRYKGLLCKYAGSMPSCDFSYDGTNGCGAHANKHNFGGFRGLQSLG